MQLPKIERLNVTYHNQPVGTLAMSADNKVCTFQYDRRWLADGFSISPLELPLKSEIFIASPAPFAGNFGIFEDSLPDGYGRYLLHKALMRVGINDSNLSALDRLSIVGQNGMGALCYSPVSTVLAEKETETPDFDSLQSKALEILKDKKDADAELLLYNSGNSGGARPKAIFSDDSGHWLIKFRHIFAPDDIGQQEFECNKLAKECGIDVPEFKLVNGRYFVSKRFDLTPEGERIHTATAGALMGLSLNTPTLDYSNLLALTGYLTQSEADVEEMYRRMVFNYMIGNKDDHCKNFSFLIRKASDGKWKWHLAPAYDLTVNSEGYNGEHATSVNGTARPAISDFIAVGTRIKMRESRCRQLIDQITEIINNRQ